MVEEVLCLNDDSVLADCENCFLNPNHCEGHLTNSSDLYTEEDYSEFKKWLTDPHTCVHCGGLASIWNHRLKEVIWECKSCNEAIGFPPVKTQELLEEIPWTEINSHTTSRGKAVYRYLPIYLLKYLRETFGHLSLAFSGGTDSTLLLLLCKEHGIKIDSIVFHNTRLNGKTANLYVRETIRKLGYSEIFHITLPKFSLAEIKQMIKEDYQKATRCSSHSKNKYRCCKATKEKPMRDWLTSQDLRNETTCIIRGVRADESHARFANRLMLIRTGKIYFHDFYDALPVKVSDPIFLVTEEWKREELLRLCAKYNLELPTSSGCALCPIFMKFILKSNNPKAAKEEGLREMLSFFDQTSITDFLGVES